MGRRASFLVVTALVLLAGAHPAHAGGSWLDVSEGASVRMGPWELAYAGVGSTVTMRSEFSDGQQAPVRAGPWYAYITPDTDIGGDRTEPMLLGPVHIADTGGYPYVATTTFVVPEVPTGSYWVNVCDLGCSHGVGDLEGGTIVLGATGSEARLFARSRILTWMQEGDARTIRHLRVQRDQLRSEVSRSRREIATARAGSALASQRAAHAEADAARNQSLLERAERRADRWRLVAGGLLATFLLLAAVIAMRSKRAGRFVVPDTPAALVERREKERTGV
jgi:hypothetical protein